ncbi:MAG: peroxiredoxin [Microthrixaceae bacterium]
MTIAVGDVAPGFELRGVDGSTGEEGTWSLAQFRGRPVVLAFYPADNTPVCTQQLRAYTAELDRFEAHDAQVLALSPQGPDTHRGFAKANGGFGFPLLSDEDRAVARAYDVLGLLDLYRRTIVVVDAEGTVAWIHRSFGGGITFQGVEGILAHLPGAAG